MSVLKCFGFDSYKHYLITDLETEKFGPEGRIACVLCLLFYCQPADTVLWAFSIIRMTPRQFSFKTS